LTIVGIVGTIVALSTLGAIKKQAEIMGEHRTSLEQLATAASDNAKAALLNAEALINAERPWIMVQIKKHAPENNASKATFQFIAFNFGKTPARIVYCDEPQTECLTNPDNELTIPPNYRSGVLFRERFLAPRDNFAIGTLNPSAANIEMDMATAARNRNVSVEAMRLVAYGKIEYRDGVSPCLHKTSFCYMHTGEDDFIGGELILCGPREYNLWT
jgi:hypothetical protein